MRIDFKWTKLEKRQDVVANIVSFMPFSVTLDTHSYSSICKFLTAF